MLLSPKTMKSTVKDMSWKQLACGVAVVGGTAAVAAAAYSAYKSRRLPVSVNN